MIELRFCRYALGACVAAAMLAGCGGGSATLLSPSRGPNQRQWYALQHDYARGAEERRNSLLVNTVKRPRLKASQNRPA